MHSNCIIVAGTNLHDKLFIVLRNEMQKMKRKLLLCLFTLYYCKIASYKYMLLMSIELLIGNNCLVNYCRLLKHLFFFSDTLLFLLLSKLHTRCIHSDFVEMYLLFKIMFTLCYFQKQ